MTKLLPALAVLVLLGGPQDDSGDWKRFLKVDRWLIEFAGRCDDQFSWDQGRGFAYHSRKWAESMVLSIELKLREGGGPTSFTWSGSGDATITSLYHTRTDYPVGEWMWSKNEASGRIRCRAEMSLTERGYKVGFYPEKDSPSAEGSITGEHYYRGSGKQLGQWVLDKRDSPSRIAHPPHPWGAFGTTPLPDKGLTLSKSSSLLGPDGCKSRCREGTSIRPELLHPHAGSWRWRIVPLGTELVDVVIDPPGDYDTWLPRAGDTEAKAGAHMAVTARLVTRDGKPPKRKAKKFVFELADVSAEPGTCMNFPLKDAAATPDLAFEPDVSRLKVASNQALRGETVEGEHLAATGVVSCFDFGAYGEVQVTAEMDDGERIVGYVRGDPSRTSLHIPRRQGGSRAAAAWLKIAQAEGLADADDSENDPVGDGFKGDGLTLYEEYRGFVDRRGHRRMDPLKKELFVSDQLGDVDAAFTHFEKITGFAVRLLPKEARDDRVINFNRSGTSPRRCEQHLVILGGPREATDHKSDFAGGSTVREDNGRKKVTPVSVKRIVVKAGASEKVKAAGADGKAEDASYRQIVVVHELLHATGVEHHGDGDTLSGVTWSRDAEAARVMEGKTAIEVFRESATPVPLKSYDELFDKPFDVVLGVQGGAFSGDQSCIMRYAGAGAYVHPDNRSARRFFIAHEPAEAWGLGLCTSPDGTGVNAPGRTPSRYGKATRGNCTKQLRVSDAP